MDIAAIRNCFPALARTINGHPIVYLDNACMTLKPEAVIEAVSAYYRECPGCAGLGRSDHAFGREVDRRVYDTREKVRRLIHAKPCDDEYSPHTPSREIIFTRNATEAINLVAHSFPFGPDAVVLTTDKEHSSNLCPWRELDARGAVRHLWVPGTADNTFDLEAYERMLERENVELVTMVHVSNLDGSMIPAAEIIELAHKHGARVLLDAAQSAPHLPIDVQALDVDFLAFSLHKMCGPTGVGVLFGKEELLNDPAFRCFMTGGDTVEDAWLDRAPRYLGTPFRFEAGLQDYAGIAGAGAAIDLLDDIGFDSIRHRVDALNRHLADLLVDLSEEFEVLGPADPAQRNGITTLCFKRRGIVSLLLEDISGMGNILDYWSNIMVRTGEFCVHSWFNQCGIGREREKLRVSLYFYNTEEECEIFAQALANVIELEEYRMLPRIV